MKKDYWLNLGYAPVPVDIRKNIKDFSLKYPLEYKEIMDRYNIRPSNSNTLHFVLYSHNDALLGFNCNLHDYFCFTINLFETDRRLTFKSKNGFTFVNVAGKVIPLKNYSGLLLNKDIQDLLGISRFSYKVINFKPQNSQNKETRK